MQLLALPSTESVCILQGFTLYLKTAGPIPESVLVNAKTAV